MDEQPSDAAHGDDDVTSADAALLQRWAFGRAETAGEIDRAAAALAELERRAAAERAAAERAGAETEGGQPEHGQPERGAAESEHPSVVDESRRGRRMLVTGLAGVLAALLAIPVVATQLTLPDPDPLAIFERPATAEDLAIVEQVERAWGQAVTVGPRIVATTDRGTAAVFRASTLPDGRSTEWDVYCVMWIAQLGGENSFSAGADCAVPPSFAESGVYVDTGIPRAGEPAMAVSWGPVGPPVVTLLSEAQRREQTPSPLDLLTYPGFPGQGGASLEGIGDASRLLMGPSTVLTAGGGAPDEELNVALFLQRSRATDGGDPLFCVRGFVTYAPAAIGCRPLDAALTEGLTLYVPSRAGGWFVEVAPDGMVTADLMSEDSISVSSGASG